MTPERPTPPCVRPHALSALQITEPLTKAATTLELHRALRAGELGIDPSTTLGEPEALPGRPDRPLLVPHVQLARRSPFTRDGRAALLHAIAHIEFNAINLALDAVWRFPGLPEAYYRDWLQVAAEEAIHFGLLERHLTTLGRRYGDFDAHDGLWTMTERTKHDPLARMALVPRTLEARGLDATPPIQAKLRRAGDLEAVAILDRILTDEIGHVAIGNRWYRWLCDRAGTDAETAYEPLARQHDAPRPRPPFNLEARRAAGFTDTELAALNDASRRSVDEAASDRW